MANLLKGKNSSNANVTGGGTAIGTVNAVTGGQAPSTPLKFLFIVTDGLQDSIPSGGSSTTFGEMTSYNAETTSNSNEIDSNLDAAVCKPYKDIGFTIYVLAIEYYPIASINYYNNINNPTAYTIDDYAGKFSSGTATSPQTLTYAAVTGATSPPPNTSGLPPVDIGLQACASTNNDFFTATGASSISNAINTMLRSALASTIRLSN